MFLCSHQTVDAVGVSRVDREIPCEQKRIDHSVQKLPNAESYAGRLEDL